MRRMPKGRLTLTILVLAVVGIASVVFVGFRGQTPNSQGAHVSPTSTPTPNFARAVIPELAADGFRPTPTPLPVAVGHGYGTRVESELPLQPASESSVFRNCQVVAFYGHPTIPGLGVMGQGSTATMLAALAAQAEPYDATNGSRATVLALHVIAGVASSSPEDGTWVFRISGVEIDALIAVADEHDLLIILDTQMGTSTVEREFAYFEPYLRNPRVHLAFDPEWHMPDGVAPGTFVGSMTADEVNRAQKLLDDLVKEYNLPNKILVIHQFQDQMIRNKDSLMDYPGVDLVIDQDGVGRGSQKLANYEAFIATDGAEHGGMKVFYTEDSAPLLTPAEVNALVPQPDLVIYQ